MAAVVGFAFVSRTVFPAEAMKSSRRNSQSLRDTLTRFSMAAQP